MNAIAQGVILPAAMIGLLYGVQIIFGVAASMGFAAGFIFCAVVAFWEAGQTKRVAAIKAKGVEG